MQKKYDREIICIFELQEVGHHGLEDINTYAGVGLDALWGTARSLSDRFDYERLSFAYHYYDPLKKMLLEI